MHFIPKDDRLLVKPKEIDNSEISSGGIVVVKETDEQGGLTRGKTMYGIVISLGPGKILDDGTRRRIQFEKNDVVVFGEYGATEIIHDGAAHFIVSEVDILGKFLEI